MPLAVELHCRERHFDREFCPVPAQGHKFARFAYRRAFASAGEMCQTRMCRLVKTGRHNEPVHRLADGFFLAIAEHCRGGRIPQQNSFILATDDDEAVADIFHGDAEAFLAVAQNLLRLLALGNVREAYHRPCQVPLFVADGRADIFDREAGAILAPEYLVIHTMDIAIAVGCMDGTILVRIPRPIGSRVMKQGMRALADDLFFCPLQHLEARRIDEGGTSFGIQTENALARRFQNHGPEPGLLPDFR